MQPCRWFTPADCYKSSRGSAGSKSSVAGAAASIFGFIAASKPAAQGN
jgi:hypothetical protein